MTNIFLWNFETTVSESIESSLENELNSISEKALSEIPEILTFEIEFFKGELAVTIESLTIENDLDETKNILETSIVNILLQAGFGPSEEMLSIGELNPETYINWFNEDWFTEGNSEQDYQITSHSFNLSEAYK